MTDNPVTVHVWVPSYTDEQGIIHDTPRKRCVTVAVTDRNSATRLGVWAINNRFDVQMPKPNVMTLDEAKAHIEALVARPT